MIFFRLRNNPQIPTKKRVKDTPKILNKLIGIFSLFYATWAFTPFDQVAVSQPPTIGQNTKYFSSKTLCGQFTLLYNVNQRAPHLVQLWRCPVGIELGAFLPLVLLYGALAQRDDTL